MIKTRCWLVVGMILLITLMGCASLTQTPELGITVIAPSPTIVEGGYPAPTMLNAYPPPTGSGQNQVPPVTKVVPTAIPQTPDPNLAIVKGRLLLNDKPVAGVILYLAEVIYGPSGKRVVAFDRTTSFRTVSDETGNFTFLNIPIGEYGLVLDRVIDSYLLLTPEGDSFVITISANEQIDLGELNYEDLPVPKEP